jgi:hypothetical protein
MAKPSFPKVERPISVAPAGRERHKMQKHIRCDLTSFPFAGTQAAGYFLPEGS